MELSRELEAQVVEAVAQVLFSARPGADDYSWDPDALFASGWRGEARDRLRAAGVVFQPLASGDPSPSLPAEPSPEALKAFLIAYEEEPSQPWDEDLPPYHPDNHRDEMNGLRAAYRVDGQR